MTVKKRRTSRKKITLNEFKAWLDGVEELQDSEWFPTKDQWTTIRRKINTIALEEAHQSPSLPHFTATPPSISQYPVGGPPAVPLPPHSEAFSKTEHNSAAVPPNLDTSNGSYDSSFE